MSHSNENPLPQNPSEATEQQDGNDLINQFLKAVLLQLLVDLMLENQH